MYRFLAHFSLTWVLGKAEVRSVSCVSSIGRRLGTLQRARRGGLGGWGWGGQGRREGKGRRRQ